MSKRFSDRKWPTRSKAKGASSLQVFSRVGRAQSLRCVRSVFLAVAGGLAVSGCLEPQGSSEPSLSGATAQGSGGEKISSRLEDGEPVVRIAIIPPVGYTGPDLSRPARINQAGKADRLDSADLSVPEPVLAMPPARPERLSSETIEVPKPVWLRHPPRPAKLVASRSMPNTNDAEIRRIPTDRQSGEGLRNFIRALGELESGERTRPLRILHLGDSHIASDVFTRGLRRRLQKRFGDAGRGLMQPPNAFRWHRIEGVDMHAEGWDMSNSLTEKTGPYGITGVRASTSTAGAELKISSRGEKFDHGVLHYLAEPGAGTMELQLGDNRITVASSASSPEPRTIAVEGAGASLSVTSIGDGPVTVFGWSLEKKTPGIQYINLGIPGAAIYSARAWSPEIIASDINGLEPDLVIFGYGSNDAFNISLDESSYRGHVDNLMDQVRQAAPGASFLVLGPADGARRSDKGPVGSVRCGTAFSGDWRTLPRLGLVRSVLKSVARDNRAAYWDWASMMGGTCSVGRWASVSPPLAERDHLHLTPVGYDRSAEALYAFLMDAYADARRIAQQTQ